MVLCGSESRCHNLQRMLEERGIPSALDPKNTAMPRPGQIRIGVAPSPPGASGRF